MERSAIRSAIFGLVVGVVAISVEVIAAKRRRAGAPTTKPGAPPKLQIVGPVTAGWTQEPLKRIELQPSRQYVATLQLSGLEQTFGGASDVEAELRKLGTWRALAVFDDVAKLPKALPVARVEADGRFWAVGIPSQRVMAPGDERISAMWSRPAPLAAAAKKA
jgi:hypothetical protein